MHYKLISTDDHLQEAPDAYTSRMSRRFADLAPQVRSNGDGTDSWYIYGQRRAGAGGVCTVHGVMPDRTKPPLRWEDVPRMAYVPSERVKAMDEDGVDVQTFFGNTPGTSGNVFSDPKFDEQWRLEAIRAYNDLQIDEYADPYPGRFVPLAVVPLWDVNKAVAEVRRMHQRGAKGICFAFPQQFGYHHINEAYWGPLWAEAQEADLSINLHVGSGGSQGVGLVGTGAWAGHKDMFQLAESSTKSFSANTQVMTTLLFSGIMVRYPRIKFVSAESGVGWVPYLLEMADHQWERQKLFNEGMKDKPSELFRAHCYVNFWYEHIGEHYRDNVGVDNMMWLADFAHPTCTYPTSREYVANATRDLTPAEKRKVLVDNAVKLYHLDGKPLP